MHYLYCAKVNTTKHTKPQRRKNLEFIKCNYCNIAGIDNADCESEVNDTEIMLIVNSFCNYIDFVFSRIYNPIMDNQ